MKKMEKTIVCVNEKSYKKIQGKILVIITDVHIKERLEYPKLCELSDTIIFRFILSPPKIKF